MNTYNVPNHFLQNQSSEHHKLYQTFQDQIFLQKILDTPKVYELIFSKNLLNKHSLIKSVFPYILCLTISALVYYFMNQNAFAYNPMSSVIENQNFRYTFFSCFSLIFSFFLVKDTKKILSNIHKTKMVNESQKILNTRVENLNLFSYYAFSKNLSSFEMSQQWNLLIENTINKHQNINIQEYIQKLAYSPVKNYKDAISRLNKIEKRIKNEI